MTVVNHMPLEAVRTIPLLIAQLTADCTFTADCMLTADCCFLHLTLNEFRQPFYLQKKCPEGQIQPGGHFGSAGKLLLWRQVYEKPAVRRV